MVIQNDIGVIYCAIGEEHLRRAELSLRSLLEYNPLLKAAVYTNITIEESHWYSVIRSEERSVTEDQFMLYKLDALLASPFQQTLYLDTDTYILDSISDLFKLLNNGFPLAFCHGHNRRERYRLIQQSELNRSIPYCFAPIQGGVILYEKSQTLAFFEKAKKHFLATGYYDDQAIFRELLWESNLRFYILPPEYNFNSLRMLYCLGKANQKIATPRIFHYTRHKNYNIETLVHAARCGKPRLFYFFHRRKIRNLTLRAQSKLSL